MIQSKIKYRFFASIADLVISLIVIFFIMVLTSTSPLITLIIEGSAITVDVLLLFKLIQAGIIIETFLIVYSTVIPLYSHGQTLGMYLFKIKVVKEDETECTFSSLFIRQTLANTLLPILTFGISALVSCFLILFRRDRASIGDILGKIKVVDVESINK